MALRHSRDEGGSTRQGERGRKAAHLAHDGPRHPGGGEPVVDRRLFGSVQNDMHMRAVAIGLRVPGT